MGRMNLDHIKASFYGSYSRILPPLDNGLDLLDRQLMWGTKVFRKRDGAGPDDIVRPTSYFLGGE